MPKGDYVKRLRHEQEQREMTQQTAQKNGNGPQAHPEQTYTEAPASLTIRVAYRGYDDIEFTLRDTSGVALLDKLDAVLNRLEKMGASPAPVRTQAPASQGAPAADGEPPICKYHGKMKRSTKFNGWFCPKKMADGSGYCQEKVED